MSPRVKLRGVREIYHEVLERGIFNLTIEELEAGERPGWIKRAVVVVEGEYVTMRFEVQYQLEKWKALAKYLKYKVEDLIDRDDP